MTEALLNPRVAEEVAFMLARWAFEIVKRTPTADRAPLEVASTEVTQAPIDPASHRGSV